MASKTSTRVAPEFTRTREFIARYMTLPTDDDLDVVTLWAMGTWTFSPAAPAMPVAYPYLYLTGQKGSGKSHLGMEVFKYICRNHKGVAMATGPALFRMIGDYDDETGEVVAHYPTLAIDEIDATFSGSANESLRGVVNFGYNRGGTIPRAAGKVSIQFPVFCPKVIMGIDNGYLPDTITDRSIRIDIRRANPPQELYFWEVEDEAAELCQSLSDWAKREAMVLRDYKPIRPAGLEPRAWEIQRTLVQLAKAAGVETRMIGALERISARKPTDGKRALYTAILEQFEMMKEDRLTSKQILTHLIASGVNVPGNGMKGLALVIGEDGITPKYIRLREGNERKGIIGHSGIINDQPVQRGYMRYQFDDAFIEYLEEDE